MDAGDCCGNLGLRGPDILQIYVPTIPACAEGIIVQVDIHAAGNGIGDNQRRAGQIVHAHLGMHAAFEIAIARQHCTDGQVAFTDGR